MARPKKQASTTQGAVVEKTPLVSDWPKLVVIKNDTPVRVNESVSRTVLMPYSDATVTIECEDDFAQLVKNFKHLNALNQWENGLSVTYPIGVENA